MRDKLLNYDSVKPYLNTEFIGREYAYYDSIDSTNVQGKREAAVKVCDGKVFITEEQTGGRGRLGRTWESPKFTGIWMSILLKPDIPIELAPKITVIAAAAAYNTMKEFGIDAKIKWPNDIVIDGKKICGILTEMSTVGGKIDYVIMGIGINVNMVEFPEDLKDKATSLKLELGKDMDRSKITALFLNNFEKLYSSFNSTKDLSEVMRICREGSVLIGREVRIVDGSTEFKCDVIDISEDGELIVRMKDGKIKNICSGEVSVRGIYGYL